MFIFISGDNTEKSEYNSDDGESIESPIVLKRLKNKRGTKAITRKRNIFHANPTVDDCAREDAIDKAVDTTLDDCPKEEAIDIAANATLDDFPMEKAVALATNADEPNIEMLARKKKYNASKRERRLIRRAQNLNEGSIFVEVVDGHPTGIHKDRFAQSFGSLMKAKLDLHYPTIRDVPKVQIEAIRQALLVPLHFYLNLI